MKEHEPQVRICHERIGSGARGVPNERDVEYPRWCALAASMWCFSDEHYVCEMHAHTRHLGHLMQTVISERKAHQHPESEPPPPEPVDSGERRKLDRRKS